MAPTDSHVRYTIRVPAELYEKLQESAGAKSVNAEIVERLERSFDLDDTIPIHAERIDELDSAQSDQQKKIEWLEGQVWRLLERTGLYDPNAE